MSDPTPYIVSYSFAGFQANSPTSPLPGTRVDNEFANVAHSIATILSAVSDIRRSDGALQNELVTYDSLSLALKLMFDPTNATLVADAVGAAQAYASAAANSNAGAAASATAALEQANLAIVAAGTVNLSLYLSKAGNLGGLGDKTISRANLGLGSAAVLNAGSSAGNVVQLDGAGKYPAYDGSQITNLDILPIGTSVLINGTSPPVGFLKENGALVSRVTYARLWAYAAISANITDEATWAASQWGSFSTGDLATTFRLPDSRGEFIRGWDNGRGVDIGRAIGSRQADSIKYHTHSLNKPVAYNTGANVNSSGSTFFWTGFPVPIASDGPSIDGIAAGDSESRGRNISKLVCIKAY